LSGAIGTGNAPNEADLYFRRAVAELITNDPGAAAADDAMAFKLNPTELYYVLWLHVARVQAGQNDADELAANAKSIEKTIDQSKWPGPALALFLGSLSPEQTEKAAAAAPEGIQVGQVCEAYFYVGIYQLGKRAPAAARALFQSALDHCPHDYFEYWAASFELKRMNDLASTQPK
jgi:lipoprotein NlpI